MEYTELAGLKWSASLNVGLYPQGVLETKGLEGFRKQIHEGRGKKKKSVDVC